VTNFILFVIFAARSLDFPPFFSRPLCASLCLPRRSKHISDVNRLLTPNYHHRCRGSLTLAIMSNYQYQKLTVSDAIRLILLQPSTDLDSPLVCTLLHTSLTRCHNNLIDKYTALSYVWGDPART
jgi:hypothetical protein